MGFFRAMNSAFGNGKAERAMRIANGDYSRMSPKKDEEEEEEEPPLKRLARLMGVGRGLF